LFKPNAALEIGPGTDMVKKSPFDCTATLCMALALIHIFTSFASTNQKSLSKPVVQRNEGITHEKSARWG
jgi:hypothetical protein